MATNVTSTTHTVVETTFVIARSWKQSATRRSQTESWARRLMSPRRPRGTVAHVRLRLLLLPILILAGCGGDEAPKKAAPDNAADRRAVAERTAAYLGAYVAGDGAQACARAFDRSVDQAVGMRTVGVCDGRSHAVCESRAAGSAVAAGGWTCSWWWRTAASRSAT